MGFGFNLLFILIILPTSGLLIILWIATKKKIFGKILGLIWCGIIALVMLVSLLDTMTYNNGLRKKDVYGKYIIDRSKFPGKQANWQYDHFRFEITRKDELIFYQTDGETILTTDTIEIEFIENRISDRLKINQKTKTHHILNDNPTLYRKTWTFYYVFHSQKFGNVFFTKGKWKVRE